MRVAIAFDDVAARNATADEIGVLAAVEAVEHALASLGHEPVRVAIGVDVSTWIERLRSHDVVFNLCEGIGGSSAREPGFAAVLDLLGVPFTGSGADTLALARRKDRVNAILHAAGLPVPEWRFVPNGSAPEWSTWPAIVKPAAEDGSVGIGRDAVARSVPELHGALDRARRWAPLLVQRFVYGRELNAAFVGDEALPIAEIVFEDTAWPVVDYRAKWAPGSDEDLATRPVCPAPLTTAQSARVLDVARAAWRAVGGRGYGRVDLRLDETGAFHILEVNPNPDLAPDAGLARAATAAGWGYEALVARILAEAA